MANLKITEVEGIGPAYGEKFQTAGINNTDALLDKGRTRKGRKQIAEATGLDEKKVLKFVNMSDLFRIKGVGPEFAELLEHAGVDTVKELGTRNVANLVAKMTEVNTVKKVSRRTPSETHVSDWVEQAKQLPPMIEH